MPEKNYWEQVPIPEPEEELPIAKVMKILVGLQLLIYPFSSHPSLLVGSYSGSQ